MEELRSNEEFAMLKSNFHAMHNALAMKARTSEMAYDHASERQEWEMQAATELVVQATAITALTATFLWSVKTADMIGVPTLAMAIKYVTEFTYAKHPKAGRAGAVLGQTMSHDHKTEREDDYGVSYIGAEEGRRTGQDLACFNCNGPHELRDCNKPPTLVKMREAMSKAQARKARWQCKKKTDSNPHVAD
ncbi:hypothetical protein FVE85_5076 [Porphyridium purpureum]|uniref:Uncharacterized protein n=1 Tax=Porphyridium purpureum TaxID=35688 RepID=A0A5J4Z0T8_PORPP|nr:hypothetical protein FVE85_5076 [Porphyridium purpureum]|eukprot:POR3501..scf295_1